MDTTWTINFHILNKLHIKIILPLYTITTYTCYCNIQSFYWYVSRSNEQSFQRNNPRCNARHSLQFYVNPIHSVYNVSEPASYLGPRFGSKYLLKGFEREIMKWKPTDCPCRICKIFIPNLGFIQIIQIVGYVFKVFTFSHLNYVKIHVFAGSYFSVEVHNLQFWPYTRKCGWWRINILTYFNVMKLTLISIYSQYLLLSLNRYCDGWCILFIWLIENKFLIIKNELKKYLA